MKKNTLKRTRSSLKSSKIPLPGTKKIRSFLVYFNRPTHANMKGFGPASSSVVGCGYRVDIKSFWTEGYAGLIPNSGHELAIYVPYARHYKPQLVYFLPHFQRPLLCFLRRFFQTFLSLCMACIQERLVIKSGL